MKTLFRMLVGLGLSAGVAAAGAELSPVPFVVDQQQFKAGDGIVIEQVLATSAKLEAGAKVVVRGHYQLASAAKARLGLFVTHRSPAGPDHSAPSQIKPIERTGGSFELSCEITYPGNLHVSFYPATGGEAFGGVFFSDGPRKS
jgi:hypothetical protein